MKPENRPRQPDWNKEQSFDWDYVFNLNRHIDFQEKHIQLLEMRLKGETKPLCGAIDKCSSKRDNFFCITKRPCIKRLEE